MYKYIVGPEHEDTVLHSYVPLFHRHANYCYYTWSLRVYVNVGFCLSHRQYLSLTICCSVDDFKRCGITYIYRAAYAVSVVDFGIGHDTIDCNPTNFCRPVIGDNLRRMQTVIDHVELINLSIFAQQKK